jgi:uncharacterized membrane protein
MDFLDHILAYTTLPSFHPAVVHFPLALLSCAALLDVLCLFVRSYMWMDRAATASYLGGTIGAGLAYLSGLHAAGSLASIPEKAAATLTVHKTFALYTIAAFAGVTILRFLVTRLSLHDNRIHLGFFRLLALPAALAAVVLLAITADHGGGLVYQHGVGVEAPLEFTSD